MPARKTTRTATGPRRERLPAEERRAHIVAVAARLFRAGHYADVSLDLVAERAGVTRGLINHHFGTKRGLYIEVLRHVMDVNRLPVPDDVHGQSLEDRLAGAIAAWLDGVARSKELYLASVRPQAGGDADVLAVVEEAREGAAQRIGALIGAGPADRLAARQLALLRIAEAAAEAILLQWLDHDRLTRAEAQDLVLALLLGTAEQLLPTVG